MVLVHQAAPWRAPPAASSRLPQTAGRDKGRTGGGGGASSGPPAGTPARRTSRFPEGGAAGLRARVRRERLSPGVRESEPSRPTCATTHPCREAGGLSAPGPLWGPSSGKAPSVVPLARSGSAVTHSQIIAPDSGLQGTRPVTAKKPCQPRGLWQVTPVTFMLPTCKMGVQASTPSCSLPRSADLSRAPAPAGGQLPAACDTGLPWICQTHRPPKTRVLREDGERRD